MMTKKIMYNIGLLLLLFLLSGCSMENDSEGNNSPEETNVSDDEIEEMSDRLNIMEDRIQELENTLSEQNIELENQRTLMSLFPQSWETAEEFLEAYVNLDYDVLDELTSDDYSIEEKGIVLIEDSTHTTYLDQYDELDYLLNNFSLVENSRNEIRMNIQFFLINDGEIENIEFRNLILEKISEEWIVTYIESS